MQHNLKCYAIDDERHAIELLVRHIEKCPGLELIGTAENPLEALKEFQNGLKPDITFLDIDMPQLSGLEVADIIKDKTEIIFTTAFADYAVEGFDKNITDFLLKPISFERFVKCVNKVTNALKLRAHQENLNEQDEFFINPGVKGKMVRLQFSKIFYIEGLKNHIVLHTEDSKHITYLRMKDIEDFVPSTFVRIHKTYIVNTSKISMIDGSKIVLLNNIVLPLGGVYKETFLQEATSRLIRSNR
ncbi:LytTR family DNA-binding domain-containing protein [Pedobacter sp. SYSU D00535]|uniref:LytR/AlgR family response regulator transcription factor n=1 Tax=Pedobacter sp. SYSU D00535 TaxID=2810308 RepID=UPI001A967F6C|nr:LytTR family DNA-binding domain-containing protein [Pedobacter sp. SYSU D00535]